MWDARDRHRLITPPRSEDYRGPTENRHEDPDQHENIVWRVQGLGTLPRARKDATFSDKHIVEKAVGDEGDADWYPTVSVSPDSPDEPTRTAKTKIMIPNNMTAHFPAPPSFICKPTTRQVRT